MDHVRVGANPQRIFSIKGFAIASLLEVQQNDIPARARKSSWIAGARHCMMLFHYAPGYRLVVSTWSVHSLCVATK